MNPIGHSQQGQSTHQEYEARYGNHYSGDSAQMETEPLVTGQKLVLAFGSLSAIVALIILFF